jgi:hypothetical protein
MIFLPGFILLGMLILLLFSPRLQAAHAGKGLAAVFGIDSAVVLFLLWLNRGHLVAWDNARVFVRQPDTDLFLRRHPIASVPFEDIRGIIFRAPPRGIPPKFPLLELDAPLHAEGSPLLIDPNYFTASSLTMFINDLRQRLPQLREGKQAKSIDGLLKILARQTRSR